MTIVPKRFENASISNGDEWNTIVRETAIHFVENFEKYAVKGLAPAFFGTSGFGKSYAAAAIVNELEKKNQIKNWELDISWCPTAEVFDQLIAFKDFRDRRYFKLSNTLRQGSLIVLDDFAQLGEYPRLREAFWFYINHRYEHMLPTIFTANFDLEKLGWEGLDNLFGEPLRRRIQEMTEGLTVIL